MTNEELAKKLGFYGCKVVDHNIDENIAGYALIKQGDILHLANHYRLAHFIKGELIRWDSAYFTLYGEKNDNDEVAIKIANLIKECNEA